MRSFVLPFLQTDAAKREAFERLLLLRMRAARRDATHIAQGRTCD
jgi:hypothetical protein